ncbi:MAG: DJ-1 family glyoxalase III [Planctomycetota bacterium]|jgi:4-methyl-5(b-hydroxyethyl)-thiazole monophosphate biosynthesis
MKRVLVILAEGFEEIEAVTPIDVLRRAGAEVTAAGLGAGPVKGSRGVTLLPDAPLSEIEEEEFDLVVLPGGPGAAELRDDPRVTRILTRTLAADRRVGAICASPAVVLSTHGFLAGKRATCHPNVVSEHMKEGDLVDERVVVDGNVTTGKGAGTAMEFAMALVAELFGPEKVEEVNARMYARLI